jgi:hypothetical protein
VSKRQPSILKVATIMFVPPNVMLGTSNVSPSVGSIHLLVHLQQQFIQHSKFPIDALIFFVKKKKGFLQMCVDYCGLN